MALLWVDLQTALHEFAYMPIDLTPDRLAEVEDRVLKAKVFNYPIHNITRNQHVKERAQAPNIGLGRHGRLARLLLNFRSVKHAIHPTDLVLKRELCWDVHQLDHCQID